MQLGLKTPVYFNKFQTDGPAIQSEDVFQINIAILETNDPKCDVWYVETCFTFKLYNTYLIWGS